MISLIIPFHQNSASLQNTAALISVALVDYPIEEVIFSYNGKPFLDKDIKNFIESFHSKFKVCETPFNGIGAGYKKGILEAKFQWILLSASDLPFLFTDVENFLKALKANGDAVYFGSKLHPESKVERSSSIRSALTIGFFVFRRILFGPKVPRDCQGTIFLPLNWAREFAEEILDDDYVFSFKLSQLALFRNHKIVEVPVTLLKTEDASSVDPLKTSCIFIFKITFFRIQTWFRKEYF